MRMRFSNTITRWRHYQSKGGLRVLQRVLTGPNSGSFSVLEQNPDSSLIFRSSVWALALCSPRTTCRMVHASLWVGSPTLSQLPEHSLALVSLYLVWPLLGLLFSENLYCACRCSPSCLGDKSFNPSVPPFPWVGWLKREGKLRTRKSLKGTGRTNGCSSGRVSRPGCRDRTAFHFLRHRCAVLRRRLPWGRAEERAQSGD